VLERHRRDRARVEAVGQDRRIGRIELAPEPVRSATHALLSVASEAAVEVGPRHLGIEVQRQAVVPDPHHVLRLPAGRLVAEDAELLGELRGIALRLRDESIHARDEALGDALGVGPVGQPFAVHVAAVEDGPRHGVALGERGPEVPGHLPEPALPPEIHLPQPVARGHEPLGDEGVVKRLGLDVRDAPLVDPDGRRLLEAGDRVAVAGGRLVLRPPGGCDEDDTERHG
jgi:hypothetical protein